MTPEKRLDRAERILVSMALAGRRARSEWGQKVNMLIEGQLRHDEAARENHEMIKMLIQAQMETSEQIKGLSAGHAKIEKLHAELAESHKLTAEALRTHINSLNKGGDRNSSD
jgi:hypothetical protein